MPPEASSREGGGEADAEEVRARKLLSWAFVLAGGAAGALAFEPFGMAWLIPLTPLGMFIGMRLAPTRGGAFGRVFAGCYVFYLASISWLMTLTRFFPIVALGILFVAVYMAFFPALSAWAIRRFMPGLRLGAQFVVFGALWVFWEWFRTLGELSYGWSQLGHPWAQWPVVIQIAELFGELGVSVVTLLMAGALLATLRWWRLRAAGRGTPATVAARIFDEALEVGVGGATRGGMRPARSGGALAIGLWGAVVLTLSVSWLRFEQWEMPESHNLRVAAIQPNISQDDKMARYTLPAAEAERLLMEQDQIVSELLAEETPRGLDLVVMPESVFPEVFFSIDRTQQLKVLRIIQQPQADVLFGATRVTLMPDRQYIDDAWNSAWFVPAGEDFDVARVQDKMRLVPFGEHLSYFRYVPFFKTIVPMEEFAAGERVVLFETEGYRFGTLVCFESSLADQARKVVRAGAEFLTVITNDAWYGRSAGAAQHRNHSLLRAVETRRPLVRAANTGISAIITPAGTETARMGLYERGVLTGEISPQNVRTFFVRWGNLWLILACVAVIAAGFVWSRMERNSKAGPAG